MTYSFHPEARQELREAAAYYREQGGKALAKAFVTEIHRVANLLVENPGFGTPAGDGRRRYPTKRFPYSLIYVANENGIDVLVVEHQMRRPGYWLGRK